LEKRRIAFIYYLVPPWDDKDGGTLDLFDTDGEMLTAILCCVLRRLAICCSPVLCMERMLQTKEERWKID